MKKLLLLLIMVSPLSACDKFMPKKQVEATPVLQEGEKVTHNFDVDFEKTAALKKSLLDKYPPNLETATIEEFLKTDEFECRDDPTKKEERACDKVENSADCILMSVVRTKPYMPDKAQVIKVCGVGGK